MNSALDEYIKYLELKNRSENTITAYKKNIADFEKWHIAEAAGAAGAAEAAGRSVDYAGIQKSELVQYMQELNGLQYSPASVCQKISALKNFFKWLKRNDKIPQDVSEILDMPTLEKRAPRAIDDEGVYEILKAAQDIEDGKSEKVNYRNFAIIYLFLNCGLRKSELINIKLADVDIDNNKMLIRGKGNKQRYAYFNDEMKNILTVYLNDYRPEFKSAKASEYLFVSTKAEKITTVQMKYIFDDILERSGLQDKGYKVHTLRKTCATLLYKGGTDVSTIKELLGHSKVETTYIYLAIPEENKKNAGVNMVIG